MAAPRFGRRLALRQFRRPTSGSTICHDSQVAQAARYVSGAEPGLSAMLRALRDRLAVDEAAQLGVKLPILIRGASPGRAPAGCFAWRAHAVGLDRRPGRAPDSRSYPAAAGLRAAGEHESQPRVRLPAARTAPLTQKASQACRQRPGS